MSIVVHDLDSLVHRHGYRLTTQRQVIFDAVRAAGRHTTVDEIYARVRKRSAAISLPTVYRTLDFLCDLRLVVAIHIGRRTYYEIAGETPHHHMICRSCGSMQLLPDQELRRFVTGIRVKHKFVMDMNHLGLFGLCAKCAKAQIAA